MAHAFAGYPAPFIFDAPGGTKTQQLIWGDFVTLFNEDDGAWTKVRSRRTTGWMKTAELQPDRLLEVNFVDIGQGDGAFIVTPDDRFLLLDAGESDNMLRFLSWRFNLRHASGPGHHDPAGRDQPSRPGPLQGVRRPLQVHAVPL
jgi:hypothetical protein